MEDIDYAKFVNKQVKVISADVTIKGRLISIDGYLNLALERAIVDTSDKKDIMSSIFIKGSNVDCLILDE